MHDLGDMGSSQGHGNLSAPPRGEHRLDRALAAGLPSAPAVYAAWIADQVALDEAGIEGPPPVLLYVGKATGRGGLKARLRRHAVYPWWELIDLLASRRTVKPAWWSHAQKNTARRTLAVPPLAMMPQDQGRAWQHRNLRWGWITDPGVDIGALEAALIARHRPLINRRGQGYDAQRPMQLQNIGPYERERAWWLFHVSWLAVLTLRPEGWIQSSWASRLWPDTDRVACDQDGWPTPFTDGVTHAITIPDERTARQMLVDVAPRHLRRKVASHRTNAEQATAWWAAYAGHPFLRDSQPQDEALHAALACSEDAYRGPPSLPFGIKLDELLKLVRRLPWVTH